MSQTKEQYEIGSRWFDPHEGEQYVLCIPHVLYFDGVVVSRYWAAIGIDTGCRWTDMTIKQNEAVSGLQKVETIKGDV